jgi:hypothetical protein
LKFVHPHDKGCVAIFHFAIFDFGFNSPLFLNTIKTFFQLFRGADQVACSPENGFKRLKFVTQTTGNLSLLGVKMCFRIFISTPDRVAGNPTA